MAGGLGFEPRLAESESAVLPLDDPPQERRKLNSDSRFYKARIEDSTRPLVAMRDVRRATYRLALRTTESSCVAGVIFLSIPA